MIKNFKIYIVYTYTSNQNWINEIEMQGLMN